MRDTSRVRRTQEGTARPAGATRPASAARASGAARTAPRSASHVRSAAYSSSSPRGVSDRTAHATRTAQSHMRAAETGRRSHSRAAAVPQHHGRTIALVALLALVIIAVSGALFMRFSQTGKQVASKTNVAAGQEVTITIPEGAGGSTIVQLLMDNGVISDSSAFLRAVQTQNADQKLKSGTYVLVTGSDPANVVKQLVEGPNTTEGSLTIAEGLTVSATAAQVESVLGISADDFINQAKASNYVSDYPFLANAANDSLEGFLYPKTYDFSGKEVTADSVIRAMLNQYQHEVASIDMSSARAAIKSRYGVDMSDYDVLIMASIVEREALTDDDRVKIASVFYNRMSQGMALQSDATMGYVTGGTVSADDLKQDSPYNTYLYQGLTPTPICSPSQASINAVLNPDDTNYLYFWITESEHVFSETYDQHLAAIAASGSTGSTGNGSTAETRS
ncbi:MAG: endolytic transglycosylase MltG [Atopobiaceae bacterium]|jgi:UPF0755 protein